MSLSYPTNKPANYPESRFDLNEEPMKFIEMTGKRLADVVQEDEINAPELPALGVNEETIIRINQQGDVEVRRPEGWDVIGGLLGEFESRIKEATGLDWV